MTGLAAAVLAACLHVVVIAWLMAQRVTPTPRADGALQVHWIEAPAPAPVRDTDRAQATRLRPAVSPPQAPPIAPESLTGPPAPSAAGPAGPPRPHVDGHALMRQAQALTRAQPLEADFLPDPLRHRPSAGADGRFAMRDPVSVADVAHAIGQLLGGPGYTTDPCPRVRHNIAALGSGGDAELLDEELRRLRKLCL